MPHQCPVCRPTGVDHPIRHGRQSHRASDRTGGHRWRLLRCGRADTHADTVQVAVVDLVGRELGDREFPTTPVGYDDASAFLTSFGAVRVVGIEGTSSYGAGPAVGPCGGCSIAGDRADRDRFTIELYGGTAAMTDRVPGAARDVLVAMC